MQPTPSFSPKTYWVHGLLGAASGDQPRSSWNLQILVTKNDRYDSLITKIPNIGQCDRLNLNHLWQVNFVTSLLQTQNIIRGDVITATFRNCPLTKIHNFCPILMKIITSRIVEKVWIFY